MNKHMNKHWIVIALFIFAGCQPDVQESPAAQPATDAKTEQQKGTSAVPPDSQKAPAKIVVVPQDAKPAQPKPVTAKVTTKPEAIIAPPVEASFPMDEPALAAKPVVPELPAAIPAPRTLLSEAEAMALAKKKNCFACHALEKKVVGPAWRMVAEKYRGDTSAQVTLEAKVRKGGKGVWGSVAMPPQSALSGEELTGLVQFVLQLK